MTSHIVSPLLTELTFDSDIQVYRYQRELTTGTIAVDPSPEFVVVGDSTASRALPLNYSMTNNALSFAVPGGTAFDSYLLLKRYLGHRRGPRCIVLMTSYSGSAKNFPSRFFPSLVRNRFYTRDELDELYDESRRLNVFPAANMSYVEYRYRTMIEENLLQFRWKSLSDLVIRPGVIKRARQIYRRIRLNRGAYTWIRGLNPPTVPFAGPYQLHLEQPFAPEPLVDRAIEKLAGIDGAKLLILNPPIARKLRSATSLAWLTDYQHHIEKIASQHGNIVVHFRDPWMNDFEFADGSHLFADSAQNLLKDLLPTIRECATP